MMTNTQDIAAALQNIALASPEHADRVAQMVARLADLETVKPSTLEPSDLVARIIAANWDVAAVAAEDGIRWSGKGATPAQRKAKREWCAALDADATYHAAIDRKVLELVEAGALFVISHSAGKDSQAMYLKLRSLVPQAQRLVVHARLPEADWPGLDEHIRATIDDGDAYVEAVAVDKAGNEKTFFDMVEASFQKLQRKGNTSASPWPSPAQRQCTSDLKRDPIRKQVRRYSKANGFNLIVDCVGLRSEESPLRTSYPAFELAEKKCQTAGRTWYTWLPIKDMLVDEVFATIADAGQQAHWAYDAGMSRLSCTFCIMAAKPDLKTAARLRPELAERIAQLEDRYGKTFSMSRTPFRQLIAK